MKKFIGDALFSLLIVFVIGTPIGLIIWAAYNESKPVSIEQQAEIHTWIAEYPKLELDLDIKMVDGNFTQEDFKDLRKKYELYKVKTNILNPKTEVYEKPE